jgi:hypothetical protein
VTAGDDSDPAVFFTEKRGIPEAIWSSRPYAWWTPEHPEPATAPFADLSGGQRRHVARIAAQSAGWVITRHAPPLPLALPGVYPELRPITPVKTRGPHVHWHGDGPEPAAIKPWQRLPGGPGSKTWTAHIARAKGRDDHRGVNTEELHSHQKLAKYVFVSSPTIDGAYVHDHNSGWRRKTEKERAAYREAHIARQHRGADTAGPHVHTHRVKDRGESLARRIDVHPLAVPLLEDAQVIFFAIEGCIKSDAILADGGAVFSVPSVSLWDCDELEIFARHYLEGRTVVIVPDADWQANPLVINQARLCQNRLRRLGVAAAHVAASPTTHDGHKTKGVDDFVGAGGHLEDLLVIDYSPPDGLAEFVISRCWSYRRDRARRDAEVLNGLSNFTGSDGVLYAPLRTVARVLAVDVKRVSRAVADLAAMGALTIPDGDLVARQGFFGSQLEWVSRPTLELVPQLRVKEQPPTRLGDLISELRPPEAEQGAAA